MSLLETLVWLVWSIATLPITIATSLYSFLNWLVFGLPVSHPGFARPHRNLRVPKWSGHYTPVAAGWESVTAEESHAETNKGSKFKLTGEPSGRQIWRFKPTRQKASPEVMDFDASRNPNGADRIFRAQQLARWRASGGPVPAPGQASDPARAAHKAVAFYQMLQCDDGHWAGDYGGPMFLLPGLVVTCYASGQMDQLLPASHREAMVAYLRNHQQVDGGWGTHIESASTMFGSVMSYIALRLLGVDADDSCVVQAREFIHTHGGALYTSSWAKFWLAVLGVMDWDALNPVPPEMWLLPDWFPFHPGRLWCHCRMVYLPMCYLYGKKYHMDASKDPLLLSLRQELYTQPYEAIPWATTRHWVAPMDDYSPVYPFMRTIQNGMMIYEKLIKASPFLASLRKKALDFAFDYMRAEDKQTNYVDIGPVNKAMNMLCTLVEHGGDAEDCDAFQRHAARLSDYLWVAEDGMKMNGYNGSQAWDTSFAIQAIITAGLAEEFPDCTRKVWRFLERTQILSTEVSQGTEAYSFESVEMREKYYRHVSKGGWPFSTSAHGWPISDCTAEGLKAVLNMRDLSIVADENPISDQRLFDAVNVLLTLQNDVDGGWATYENNRGYGWYELLNPSEVFGDIMIDYSYVECSSASLTALYQFAAAFPEHRAQEIQRAIRKGREFLKSIQRDDGSWYGSWAVCFTYACWFGVEGLVKSGEPVDSPHITMAVKFLLGHQNANGGWGEGFPSSFDKDYAVDGTGAYGDEGSGVVQTAWALLALMASENTAPSVQAAVERGVRYLMTKQLDTGDFEQEGITGVFNRACGITYTAYRNVFPIWALGTYNNHYKPKCGAQ